MTPADDTPRAGEEDDAPAAASGGRSLYLVAIGLAVLALALGLWDVAIERDAGDSPFLQLAFPVGLLILVFILHHRARGRSK